VLDGEPTHILYYIAVTYYLLCQVLDHEDLVSEFFDALKNSFLKHAGNHPSHTAS
jgi:hypothetical protein